MVTTCGQGQCVRQGETLCENGIIRDTCRSGTPSLLGDLCDGLDDDCDGRTDEDHVNEPVTCGVGAMRQWDSLVVSKAPW